MAEKKIKNLFSRGSSNSVSLDQNDIENLAKKKRQVNTFENNSDFFFLTVNHNRQWTQENLGIQWDFQNLFLVSLNHHVEE